MTDKLKSIKDIINDYKQDYMQMFDILDYAHENYDELNDRAKWKRIEDDLRGIYQFDNTLENMLNENEEQFPISSTTTSRTNTDEVNEEQVLSQRLSQLTTTSEHGQKRQRLPLLITTTDTAASSSIDSSGSPKHITKKIRLTTTTTTTTTIAQNIELPSYLSSTSPLFDQIIGSMIKNPTTKDLNDIRQIAFLMHRLTGSRLLHDLWSTYLRSGTGTLQLSNYETSSSIDIGCRYWPNHVRSQMKAISPEADDDEHLACRKLVEERLHQYEEDIRSYRQQLDEKMAQCSTTIGSAGSLKEGLQWLIDQYGLLSLQMKCEQQKTNVRHQYEEELLKQQFQQRSPTNYQIQIAWRLYKLEHQLETAKYQLIEYQHRVICNKPPLEYDSLELTLPTSIHTLSDPSIQSQFSRRYQQLIQRTKTDLITVDILSKQIEIDQNQRIFNEEVDKMYENDRKKVLNKDMPKVLQSLIQERSSNLKEQLRMTHQFNMDFYIRHSFDQLELAVKQGGSEKRIGFFSNLIIDTESGGDGASINDHFTRQQMKLLNRGPTYVTPGQIHISHSSIVPSTTHATLMKQYAPLKHQLAIVFSKYHIDISRSTNFEKDVRQRFTELFSMDLPDQLYARALYEQNLIQSIQSLLQKKNLRLCRTAHQENRFYLSRLDDFTRLEQDYMESHSNDHFVLLFEITPANQQQIQEEMKRKYLVFNSELEKLFKANRLTSMIYNKLCIQWDKVKLPYVYFLPDTSNATPIDVQPMMVAHQSATSKLAQYLKQVIRPLLVRHTNRTMFLNEADFMDKLHTYTYQEKQLQPNTLFATIKIKNYTTMASHNSLVTALVNFLTDNLATNKIHTTSLTYLNKSQSISIDTIKQLTELYLQNNFFSYANKIYQCLRGAPNSLLWTDILLHIYAFAYETFIYTDPSLKSELYGRCKDEIFFTWNGTESQLITFIEKIRNQYSHIDLETSLGKHVIYANMEIENRTGKLYTCVFHDSKYTLPYVLGHTKSNHQLWFRSALMRAIRVCSNYLDFQMEQMHLEMTCLLHGYSNEFIETQLKHFYLFFNAGRIRFSLDADVYDRLRRRVFNFIPIQRTHLLKQQQLEDEDFIFHFSYPYDQHGSYNEFNQTFLRLWNKYFHVDSQLGHKDTTITLNAKSIHSLNTLLAKEKPTTKSLL